MSRYAVLLGQINRDLADLEQIIDDTSNLMEKVLETGDKHYLGTVALNLHGFYSGAERIFGEVALAVDGSLPEGSDSHRRLLRQMAAKVPDIRPALLSDATLTALNEHCAFGHLLQNFYTFDLILIRGLDLAEELPYCQKLLRTDLQEFCQFLSILSKIA
jgi:hypothetical protein